MSWSMPGSSSRTQDFDQRLASALGSAITGVVITTTTGGSATTTAAAFVVGIALSTVVASSIAAVFPAACAGWAVTATTTAAVATTTTAAVATTAAATGSASARFSFVDPKRTAHQFCTLKAFNRCVLGGLIRHLDESKTALTARIPLKGQRTVGHFTELGKQFNHIFLLSAEGKVADKNAHVLRGPGTKQWTEEALNIAIGP